MQLILACSVSPTSYLSTIDFIYVELTSYTETIVLCMQRRGKKLCQPQKLSLIYRSSKEMDESVLLSLQMHLRNMHFAVCSLLQFVYSYPPQRSASADNTNFGLDNYRYHGKTESNNC